MILFVCAVFAVIGIGELPTLIQKRMWRELVVFSVLFVFALTVSVLYALGVEVPSPMRGIKYLIEHVLKISYKG